MDNKPLMQEEEIDLREYIRVLIKRKNLILSLFFISVIAAAALSFNQPKVYTATTTLIITPSAMKSGLSASKGLLDVVNNQIGDNNTTPWSISVATHMKLLTSNLVLKKVIENLKLKDPLGRDMAIEDLLKKLNIIKAVGENVVQLEVTDTNPQQARDIANAWGQEYMEYSQEVVLGEANGIGDFVMNQFDISKKSLLQSEEMVKNFKLEYKQDLMNAELNIKKTLLNNYKTEFAGMGLDLKTKEDTLHELKKQLAGQDRLIILSKAITDDALWEASSKNDDTSQIDKKGLRSESINPIYQDLETRMVDEEIEVNTLKPRMQYLNEAIETLTKEANALDEVIIQKDFDMDQLSLQAEISRKSYDVLSNKIYEARMIKAIQLGDVKTVSPATTPSYPVGRGKMKILLFAGILGLVMGVFLSFIMEYWKGK